MGKNECLMSLCLTNPWSVGDDAWTVNTFRSNLFDGDDTGGVGSEEGKTHRECLGLQDFEHLAEDRAPC